MGKVKYNEETGILYREWSVIEGIELREEWNENEDCAVRALASATECTYQEAHEYCKKYMKRENRDGAVGFGRVMDERMGLSFLNNCTYNELKMEKTLTVKEFYEKYAGNYIVAVKGHVFTIKHKCIIGNPEDSQDVHKIVNFAYQVYKSDDI